MKNIFDASLRYIHFFKSEFLNLLGVFVPSTEKIVLIKTCFSYTCMYLHIASYKDQVNRALIFFKKQEKVLSLIWLKTFVFSIFFYYDSTIILHLHYAYSMMHFLLFCSVSSSLLPSSLTHPTALSVCWPGNFPLSFPSYISCFSNVASILPLLHTSGSLLCWWGQSPIQDVWACSFPPHHLLRCSLAPSLNGEPSPRRRGRAMHGPQSPFSQNHETTSSTAFLQGRRRKKCLFFLKHTKNKKKTKPDEKIQWEFCTFPATDITEKFLQLCKYCFIIKHKYIITIMDSAFVWWLHMQVWLVPKEQGRVCAAWLNRNDWNHPMTDFCTLV